MSIGNLFEAAIGVAAMVATQWKFAVQRFRVFNENLTKN